MWRGFRAVLRFLCGFCGHSFCCVADTRRDTMHQMNRHLLLVEREADERAQMQPQRFHTKVANGAVIVRFSNAAEKLVYHTNVRGLHMPPERGIFNQNPVVLG